MVVEKDSASTSSGRRPVESGQGPIPSPRSADSPRVDDEEEDERKDADRAPLISRHTRKADGANGADHTSVEVGSSEDGNEPPQILTPEELERKRQMDEDAGEQHSTDTKLRRPDA
jgi:hypothetical protein